MSPRLFALAILLTAPAAPRAQQVEIPPAVRAAADKITADQLKKDLDYLASDELKGRNTDSPGYDMAADYIARRLERAGLQPLGDEGTFFQRYVIREIQADAANAYVEIDGKRLKLGDDFVVRSLTGAMSGARQVVYVVDAEGVVGQKVVSPGRLLGGLRVITEGLTPQDRVIISGVQRARPGRRVTAKEGVVSAFPTGVSRGEDSTLTLPAEPSSGGDL